MTEQSVGQKIQQRLNEHQRLLLIPYFSIRVHHKIFVRETETSLISAALVREREKNPRKLYPIDNSILNRNKTTTIGGKQIQKRTTFRQHYQIGTLISIESTNPNSSNRERKPNKFPLIYADSSVHMTIINQEKNIKFAPSHPPPK